MPGDTSYDIWTDWPMFLWRNDAELAGPHRTAEIADASGMLCLLVFVVLVLPFFGAGHFLRISGCCGHFGLDSLFSEPCILRPTSPRARWRVRPPWYLSPL